jgi:hypothetical protein
MNFAEIFAATHPKAVYLLQTEYDAEKEAAEQAASEYGYRLAGLRLGWAVFTTKEISK